jgi:demethylmenaquinone methyltransferase/2-methoxy-6-polyprenyl-1,4-benzoquinol methylase
MLPRSPLPTPERKVAFVQAMFARIAARYDAMNRLMTFGMDKHWRRRTVREVLASRDVRHTEGQAAQPPLQILDVATGTGYLALEVLHQEPSARVVGLDLVPQMLAVARRKAGQCSGRPAPASTTAPGTLHLVLGDALRLPFPDAAFDGVVTGFALRNVLDISTAFREMARVTRRGGRLACLEISKPCLPIFRQLFSVYFFRMVPLLGRLMAGEASAYTYLPHSLAAFLTPDEIVSVMQAAGWRNVRYRRLMLGTVALHAGVRQ